MYFKIFNFNIELQKKYETYFIEAFPSGVKTLKEQDNAYKINIFTKPIKDKIIKNFYQIKCGYVRIDSITKNITVYLNQKVFFPEFFTRLFIYIIKSEGFLINTFLIHSSSVIVNDNAYLIPGLPSSGKSTLCNIINEIFKDQSSILNDDLTLCCFNENKSSYDIYRIPHIDDLTSNRFYFEGPFEIKKIIFPHIDKNTYFKELTPIESMKEFLKDNAFMHANKEDDLHIKTKSYKDFLRNISKKISSGIISYNIKKDKAFIKQLINNFNN